MNFGSKWVLDCESDEESLSDDDLCYSGEEDNNDSDDEKIDEKKKVEDKKRLKTHKVRRADTNVIGVAMKSLASSAQLLTGDPIFCTNCAVVFNHLSKITSKDNEQQWICEFCSNINPIHLEEEERPTAESGDYMLETFKTSKEETEKSSKSHSGFIVFCIDISGSMCVTTEITGTHKFKGHERLDQLKQLNTEGANQYLPRQKRNTTFISRLQCCQAAVEEYISNLIKESPDTVVGLVTFNGEVTIIGDGSKAPVTVTGDKLKDYEALLKAGKDTSIDTPISKSEGNLRKCLFKIEESGPTALGPALLVSLGMASSYRGSQVIICTDGLANVGLGSQDDLKTEEQKTAVSEFYSNMGDVAAGSGISVSVISIKGTDANMENLGKLSDRSGGKVKNVDPLRLHEEFASILSEKVIATNVVVDLFLHRGLHFRNAEQELEAAAATASASAATELKSDKKETPNTNKKTKKKEKKTKEKKKR